MEENNFDEKTPDQFKLEDAQFTVEVLRRALELRPLIREAIIGEKFRGLSTDKQISESITPRVSFFFVNEEKTIPAIFFRFVGEETPILEVVFYPFEAILSFLDEARKFVDRYLPSTLSSPEKKDLTFNYTLEMTLILLDNFYRRAQLTMDSITLEIIGQWHWSKREDLLRNISELGDKPEIPKFNFLDSLLNNYKKDISQFWKYQGQSLDNWRKISLVDEYEGIFQHWTWLMKMLNSGADWMQYAKAGKHQDTPDDLLNKLWDVDRSAGESIGVKISELAIEHAARRVGLIKKNGVSEFARNKRKQGIKLSDYSSQQLFNFLKEGKELKKNIEENKRILAQIETEPSFEQVSNSALTEKRKLLEQKIQFVKENIEKQLEQKAESAQNEN